MPIINIKSNPLEALLLTNDTLLLVEPFQDNKNVLEQKTYAVENYFLNSKIYDIDQFLLPNKICQSRKFLKIIPLENFMFDSLMISTIFNNFNIVITLNPGFFLFNKNCNVYSCKKV